MLVLRRKVGESIILDGVISVSVLAVEGERVKIGITAPLDVTIVREELLRALTTDTPNHHEPAPQR
jgi:carbon storage regulator